MTGSRRSDTATGWTRLVLTLVLTPSWADGRLKCLSGQFSPSVDSKSARVCGIGRDMCASFSDVPEIGTEGLGGHTVLSDELIRDGGILSLIGHAMFEFWARREVETEFGWRVPFQLKPDSSRIIHHDRGTVQIRTRLSFRCGPLGPLHCDLMHDVWMRDPSSLTYRPVEPCTHVQTGHDPAYHDHRTIAR